MTARLILARLAALQEQNEQAARIIERMFPLANTTPEDVAWARSVLGTSGEGRDRT